MSSANTGAKQKKKSKYLAWKVIGVLISVIIIASVTSYVVIANQYQDKFIEGTKINNFDVSNMQPEQVEELIREENPDKVILATGGTGLRPGIKGIDLPNVVSAEDILLGKIQPADQIVVAGGGEVGLETAAHLAIEELDGCAFPVDPHGLYSFRFLRQLRKSAAFDRFHDDGLPPMFPYHIITELSSCFFCLNSLESFLSKLSGKICQHLGYFDLLGTYLLTGTALKAGRRLLFMR